jgi:hypothetical protein
VDINALVTKDFLAARFAEQNASIDARFAEQSAKLDSNHRIFWTQAIVMAAVIWSACCPLDKSGHRNLEGNKSLRPSLCHYFTISFFHFISTAYFLNLRF